MAAEQQKRFGEKKQKQVVRFSSVNVIHCYDRKLPVTKRLSFGKEDTLVCPVWTKKAASAIAKLDPQTLETLVHGTCTHLHAATFVSFFVLFAFH